MGIYRPFIGGVKDLSELDTIDHTNDKPFTLPDLMTVSRPALAALAGGMLLSGERGSFGVAPLVIGMAATDMEGKLARLIDKLCPGSGWGSTEHGAAWDTYADTSALLIIGGAIMLAPLVSKPAKVATGLVLAQETWKAKWALERNKEFMSHVDEHKDLTDELLKRRLIKEEDYPEFPSKLELPASLDGKEAMARKLTAIVFSVATHDTDNQLLRAGYGATALGFAITGSKQGEEARQVYEPLAENFIQEQIVNVREAQLLLAA